MIESAGAAAYATDFRHRNLLVESGAGFAGCAVRNWPMSASNFVDLASHRRPVPRRLPSNSKGRKTRAARQRSRRTPVAQHTEHRQKSNAPACAKFTHMPLWRASSSVANFWRLFRVSVTMRDNFLPIRLMDRIRHWLTSSWEGLLSEIIGDKETGSVLRAHVDPDRVLALMVFARLDLLAAACGAAACGGVSLLLATYVLLLMGAPTGVPIGPNLAALSTFLPGYAVSWAGGVVGMFYGFVIGGALGLVFAAIWNFTHVVALGLIALRGLWLDQE